MLLSYLSFAVSFFIRLLGGVIFSHIDDRVGRKRTLVLMLSLMGGGTALIGFLPTYDSIGNIAPLLRKLDRSGEVRQQITMDVIAQVDDVRRATSTAYP
jgi:MFS family permease